MPDLNGPVTRRIDRNGVMTVTIPVTFAQAGGRKQIITPVGSADWEIAPARQVGSLVNALTRAHRWRHQIETGKYSSAAELARKEKANESYVCRLLRLTLLAPDIVEAILDGRQPKTLELRHILKPLPADWAAQRKALRFI